MPRRFLAASAVLALAGGFCLTPLLADPPDDPPPTDAGGAGAGPGAPAAPDESAEDELGTAAEAGAGAGYGGSFGNEYGGGDEEDASGAGLGGYGEDPFGAGPGAMGSMMGEGDFGDYERGVPSLPIQLSADDFAGFLVGGFGGNEDVQLAVVRREELDGGARIVLTNGGGSPLLYYIAADDFAAALERVGRAVKAEPGTTFEPRRRLAAGSEIWPLSKFEQFLDGQMPEYVSALVYRDFLTATRGEFETPGRLLPLLLEPRYGTKERRVRVRRDDLRSALENFGLTLEIGRTYRPEDGSREMRWDEDDLTQFLAGRSAVTAATITAIDDRNVEFTAKLAPKGKDQSETVRRTALADHVKRAFGRAGLPSEKYAVGAVIEPLLRPVPRADRIVPRDPWPASVPEVPFSELLHWTRRNLNDFLDGGRPGIAAVRKGPDKPGTHFGLHVLDRDGRFTGEIVTVPKADLAAVLDERGLSLTVPPNRPGDDVLQPFRTPDSSPSPVDEAPAADRPDQEPSTVYPGDWSPQDLADFLAGRKPYIESLTVREISDDATWPQVEFDVTLADGGPTQRGRIHRSNMQDALGSYGRSLTVGQVLRAFKQGPSGGGEAEAAGGGNREPSGDRAPSEAVRDLVRRIVAADDPSQRTQARDRLTRFLTEQFDAAQSGRELDLGALEAKVARLRELHEKRAAARGEIVARRLDTLLREAEGLGWGEPDGSRAAAVSALPPGYARVRTVGPSGEFGPGVMVIDAGVDDGLKLGDRLLVIAADGSDREDYGTQLPVGEIVVRQLKADSAVCALVRERPAGARKERFVREGDLVRIEPPGPFNSDPQAAAAPADPAAPFDAPMTGTTQRVLAADDRDGDRWLTIDAGASDRIRPGDELRVMSAEKNERGGRLPIGRLRVTGVGENSAAGKFFPAEGADEVPEPGHPVIVPRRPERADR